jgi:hypothetical protein
VNQTAEDLTSIDPASFPLPSRPRGAFARGGQPPEVLAYAWAAQCRLYSRFHSIAATKNRNVAVVAVARELSGFIWGLMTDHVEVA